MGHYDELGVAPTASAAEIRRSYLALARRYHPDKLGGAPPVEREQAAARMARINAAWSILSDDDRRRAYDEAGREASLASSNIRDAANSWSPYDTGEDEIDPRLLDDTPSGAPTIRRSLTFVPAGLAVAGFALSLVGFVIGLSELLAIGLLLFAAAALSFLLLPLVALVNASRADKDW